jgi:hypothetical protein
MSRAGRRRRADERRRIARIRGGEASRLQAAFALSAAFDCGIRLRRAIGNTGLEVAVPQGVSREILDPVIAAITRHKAEIIEALHFLDRQADAGIIWTPPGRGTSQ